MSSLKCSNVFNEQSLFLLSNGQKNFIASSLMFIYVQELDIRNRDIMVSIDSASDEYLRKVRDLSPSKRKQEKVNFRCLFANEYKYSNATSVLSNFTLKLISTNAFMQYLHAYIHAYR